MDSDLDLFRQLLKVTNVVPQTRQLDDWFEEIQPTLLHQWSQPTKQIPLGYFFKRLLAIVAMWKMPSQAYTFRSAAMYDLWRWRVDFGWAAFALPQERHECDWERRRNYAALRFLDGDRRLFGNYHDSPCTSLIQAYLVLLDFGAIRQFDDNLLPSPLCCWQDFFTTVAKCIKPSDWSNRQAFWILC